MNGFHIHAIGWVLVANARALTPAETHEVTHLWQQLVQRRAEDLRALHPLLQLLFPRSLPLSPSTHTALASLVEHLAAQHPERFAAPALRRRRNHWLQQAALGFLLSGLAAILVPPGWARAATLAPTFFLMGLGCLLPAVTLWRAAVAVHACTLPHRATEPLAHRS